MNARTEIGNPAYRSRRALILTWGVACSLAAMSSGCGNSLPANHPSNAGVPLRTVALFRVSDVKRALNAANSLKRALRDAAFHQVMTVLNANNDAYTAAQLNSLHTSYVDIADFFASLTAPQKRQLYQTVTPCRFNAILAKMTPEQRKAWCGHYLALGLNRLVPITTDGTTWQ